MKIYVHTAMQYATSLDPRSCTSPVSLSALMPCTIRTSDWPSSGSSGTLPSLEETRRLWPYLDRVQVPYQWHCTWQPIAVKACLARYRRACTQIHMHDCVARWSSSIPIRRCPKQMLTYIEYRLVPAAIHINMLCSKKSFLLAVTVYKGHMYVHAEPCCVP